jgi:hypothetical protein
MLPVRTGTRDLTVVIAFLPESVKTRDGYRGE